jgi:tetratricopeptide (TPR) repeat protein
MVGTVLLCCGLLGADRAAPDSGTPSLAADLAAYDAARTKVGRDAAAHVRLALWCEAHGLQAERKKHLALAILYDPSHTLARGLLGMVAQEGKWAKPEVVGRRIEKDPAYHEAIREYLERRSRTPDKADAQLKLAAWCDQKGLKVQAKAHYEQVIELDPTREAAWKHLGYKKQGGRWAKPEFAAAHKEEAQKQKAANQHWKPVLEKLRDDLESKDAAKRERAVRALDEVSDPRAVPMISTLFLFGPEWSQRAAVRMLGHIEGPGASNALAALAIFSPWREVEQTAFQALVSRDLRDILTRLIGMIRKPFEYQVRPIDGPGSAGVLFVEDEKFNVRRIYQSMPIDPSLMAAGGVAPSFAFDGLGFAGGAGNTPLMLENGMSFTEEGARLFDYLAARIASSSPTRERESNIGQLARIRQANQAAQQSLAQDVQAIEAINHEINFINGRVLPIIRAVSGQTLGAEPDKWKSWWTDQLGYAFQASQPAFKPTFTDLIDVSSWSASLECFGAGTRVHSAGGPAAIENIQVGDRVLTQNSATGALSYQPVMVIHRTKSAPTIRLDLDDESLVATGIHRFWKAGEGWTMARDLKPGDRVRMVGGVVQVRSVRPDQNQPVFNLDVGENRDFFVGSNGLLVHDSNFVNPVPEPFDGQPDLATLAAAGAAKKPAR